MPKGKSHARVPQTGDGRALHWLEGTWRTEGQLVGAPTGLATTLVAVDRYEWIPGLNLLAHYVAGHLGRTSVASFEIWSYVRARRTCISTSFDDGGVASTFQGRLHGHVWEVRGEKQRFRGTFSEDGRMLSGIWDQKSGRTWKPWLSIVLRKVSA